MNQEDVEEMYADLPWLQEICNPAEVDELIVIDLSPSLRRKLLQRKNQLHLKPGHTVFRWLMFNSTVFDDIYLVCNNGHLMGQVGVHTPPAKYLTFGERLKERLRKLFSPRISETVEQALKRHSVSMKTFGYIVFKWPTARKLSDNSLLYSIRVVRMGSDNGDETFRTPLPTNRLIFA